MSCLGKTKDNSLDDVKVVINVLPLYHIYGLATVLSGRLRRGDKIVLLSRFEPGAFLQAIQEYKVSVFSEQILPPAEISSGDIFLLRQTPPPPPLPNPPNLTPSPPPVSVSVREFSYQSDCRLFSSNKEDQKSVHFFICNVSLQRNEIRSPRARRMKLKI